MTPTATALKSSRRRGSRWTKATAVWSSVYAALGVFWAVGGAGFPFGAAQDPNGRGVSLLEAASPRPVGLVIAVVGLSGGAVAAAVATGRRNPGFRRLAIAYGWLLAVMLAVVVPDYRPLLAIIRAPVLVAGAPFGWPRQVDVTDFFGLYLPWPVLNQILLIFGGVLWAGTALMVQRRHRGACEQCGRRSVSPAWTEPAAALRWSRYGVALAVAIPIFYAVTRWAWALGIPLGVSAESLRVEARESPGIWLAGAAIATMAVAGSLLTLGLVRPWGVRYPLWTPGLSGRPVRPRTAIIPAVAVSILVTSAGLMYLRWLVLGRITLTSSNWGLFVPEMLWPLWGLALGAATFGYYLRRRGPCAECGRG